MVYAADLLADQTPMPFDFHWVNIELLELHPHARGAVASSGSPTRLEFDTAEVELSVKGKSVAFPEYLKAWGYEAAQKAVKELGTGRMAEGKYDYTLQDTALSNPRNW